MYMCVLLIGIYIYIHMSDIHIYIVFLKVGSAVDTILLLPQLHSKAQE